MSIVRRKLLNRPSGAEARWTRIACPCKQSTNVLSISAGSDLRHFQPGKIFEGPGRIRLAGSTSCLFCLVVAGWREERNELNAPFVNYCCEQNIKFQGRTVVARIWHTDCTPRRLPRRPPFNQMQHLTAFHALPTAPRMVSLSSRKFYPQHPIPLWRLAFIEVSQPRSPFTCRTPPSLVVRFYSG